MKMSNFCLNSTCMVYIHMPRNKIGSIFKVVHLLINCFSTASGF